MYSMCGNVQLDLHYLLVLWNLLYFWVYDICKLFKTKNQKSDQNVATKSQNVNFPNYCIGQPKNGIKNQNNYKIVTETEPKL